jgi:hypothetical protein
MFKLHLDLEICYSPPMSDRQQGVVLTRSLGLPFPAHKGLILHSTRMDEATDPPIGIQLREVMWDVDRQVFLARASIIEHDHPMDLIPQHLKSWIARGWRIGSWKDNYVADDESGDDDVTIAIDGGDDEWERSEALRRSPRRRRTTETNATYRAVIRHLAETYDRMEFAYAFDKTGRLFTEQELADEAQDPQVARFRAAMLEFAEMRDELQAAWRSKVMRYRGLASLVRKG